MKKKIICILFFLTFLVTACNDNDKINLRVKKIDDSELKIIRVNNVSTYFQGTFENIDLKDKELSIDAIQYLNGKKVKSVSLFRMAKGEQDFASFDFDFSILNVFNKEIILNTLYNNSAVGKEVFKFKYDYEIYTFGGLDKNIKLEDKTKVYLGYYGVNKNDNELNNIQDIKIQNYTELIVVELTIK